MRVLITGATGLVGRSLSEDLVKLGTDLIVVGRNREANFRNEFVIPCRYLSWSQLFDPQDLGFSRENLENLDAIVHLAGESISDGLWSEEKKKRILSSRIEPTQKLNPLLAKLITPPKTIISASAIGFYGNRGGEILCETSTSGRGFLADVCSAWEEAIKPAASRSRLVHLRIGIVLAANGGILGTLKPLFVCGAGGKVGGGDQWMSWIHIKDLTKMIIWAIKNVNVHGPLNAVSPQPVTNAQWTRALAKALNRPALLTVPQIALRALLGEKSHLVLDSQRVLPKVAQTEGFRFQFESVESALGDLFGKRTP